MGRLNSRVVPSYADRHPFVASRLDDGVVWEARFDLLPLSTSSNAADLRGYLKALGLTITRASAATVQTSASTVVTSGIGVDDPRVGDGGFGRGLVLEESRTNQIAYARDLTNWTAGGGTFTTGITGPDGVASATRQQLASGEFGRSRATASLAASTYAVSKWRREGSASANDAWYVSGDATAAVSSQNTIAAGAAWNRSVLSLTTTTTNTILVGSTEGRTLGAPYNMTAGARDVQIDLVQVETGKFATEVILTTGAAATRSPERLRMTNNLARSGQLNLEIEFTPKASVAADYGTFPTVVLYDINNYIAFDHTIGRLTCAVNGVTGQLTGTAISWTAGQRIRLFLSVGNGQTRAWFTIGGGSVGTSANATAMTAWPVGAVDIMCNALAQQFSSWVHAVRAYAPGNRPGWAR